MKAKRAGSVAQMVVPGPEFNPHSVKEEKRISSLKFSFCASNPVSEKDIDAAITQNLRI
jgi:hypothetical protein